jgi:hypothetical protein
MPSHNEGELMSSLSRRPGVKRDSLYALAVLPPVIFLLSGHVLLGIVFLACVMAGRFSRPRSFRRVSR